MSQKKPSGYRAPSTSKAPQGRGLLDAVFAPRVPNADMPTVRSSVARGFVTVITTPATMIAVPVVLLLEWLALVALGFQGPFSSLVAASAPPAIGTFADIQLARLVFPAPATGGAAAAATTIGGLLLLTILRALWWSLLAAAAVEHLRTGGVSRWALQRMRAVFPAALLVCLLEFGFLTVAQFLAAIFGLGPGALLLFGALVYGTYLVASVPAIAADEARGLVVTIGRAVKSARVPGTRNLLFAILYVVPMLAFLIGPFPGSDVGVNPSPVAWGLVLLLNVWNASYIAASSYRSIRISGEVDRLQEEAAKAAAKAKKGPTHAEASSLRTRW